MSKTKSLELLENLQTLQEKKPVKKRTSAPLAQQESITDSEVCFFIPEINLLQNPFIVILYDPHFM